MARMSLNQFFDELRSCNISFTVNRCNEIRTADNRCPICALAHVKLGTTAYLAYIDPAKKLGLSRDSYEAIVVAADDFREPISRLLRKRLMRFVKKGV